MEDIITFEELYDAYILCLKNKKKKAGTYNFVNDDICKNLVELLEELNNRKYVPKQSNCYVITDPALREIYAAQFSDRIVQHFYMKEIEDILDNELIDGCCSCRKERGTDYALKLLKKHLIETSNKGQNDCFFLKIDLSGYFMSIDRKQISDKFLKLREKSLVYNHYNERGFGYSKNSSFEKSLIQVLVNIEMVLASILKNNRNGDMKNG